MTTTILIISIATYITLIIGGTFYLANITRNRIEHNFREIAKRLGLAYTEPKRNFWRFSANPTIVTGIVSGLPIRIYIYSRGSGKSKIQYISFDFKLNTNHSNHIRIFYEGFFRNIAKKLGLEKDLEINDQEFDRLYIIKTDSQGFARAIFSDQNIKDSLIKNIKLMYNSELRFKENYVYCERVSSFYSKKEVDKLEITIKMALQFAKKIIEIDNRQFDNFSFS